MRAVVDTNVWISAVLNPIGLPAAVRAALQRGQFVLVISEPLLTELTDGPRSAALRSSRWCNAG